jgi:hypothetical protein
MTASPYASCFSRIKLWRLLSSGATSSLRRSFAQQPTRSLQRSTLVRSRCNSLATLCVFSYRTYVLSISGSSAPNIPPLKQVGFTGHTISLIYK